MKYMYMYYLFALSDALWDFQIYRLYLQTTDFDVMAMLQAQFKAEQIEQDLILPNFGWVNEYHSILRFIVKHNTYTRNYKQLGGFPPSEAELSGSGLFDVRFVTLLCIYFCALCVFIFLLNFSLKITNDAPERKSS